MLDVFWERNMDRIRSNLMVEQKFTVPLGGHLFKGFIDRVDMIPGTENEVEIIDTRQGVNRDRVSVQDSSCCMRTGSNTCILNTRCGG